MDNYNLRHNEIRTINIYKKKKKVNRRVRKDKHIFNLYYQRNVYQICRAGKIASVGGLLGRGNDRDKDVKKAYLGHMYHISMSSSVGYKEE